MHHFTITQVETLSNGSVLIEHDYGLEEYGQSHDSRDYVKLDKEECEFVCQKLGVLKADLLKGYKFTNKYPDFDRAFVDHVWGSRIVDDIIRELIIPALLDKKAPQTRGINYDSLNSWWVAENRVTGIKPDRIYLTAVPFYDYLNTLLPETIRITEVDPWDPRIRSHVKCQAGYFYLKHPQGDCYGILVGGPQIFYLCEFSQ